MTSNPKPIHHHRPLDKPSAPKLPKQKQQRNSINQAELSAAVAFLSGDALTQACSLLAAQSREFYANADDEANKEATSSADAAISSDSQPSSSTGDCSPQLLDIYRKSKRALEIVTQADELGQLERSSGNLAAIPSSPHPNISTTTPRSTHNTTPGVTVSGGNSMPPPPPLAGNAASIPSLHRRSISGSSSGVPLSNTRLHIKRKTADGAAVAVNTPKLLHRSNLGGATSKPSTTAEEKKSNPPEAVLNFLKKLNSNGAAEEGDNINNAASMSKPAAPMAAEAKKRKATSPPENPRREVKRTQQPPPPSATTPSNKSNICHNSNMLDSKETPSPEDRPGRRSARSTSKRSTPDSTTTTSTLSKMHEIGQSVMVRSDNSWYAAIVKDICYDNGLEMITYEVEFDNGEISSGVLPVDVRDNEDD